MLGRVGGSKGRSVAHAKSGSVTVLVVPVLVVPMLVLTSAGRASAGRTGTGGAGTGRAGAGSRSGARAHAKSRADVIVDRSRR